MELTARNVHDTITKCLFSRDEPTEPHVKGCGVLQDYAFHPDRLEEARADVASMLAQLDDSFKEGKGGGMSFLQACCRADGTQWGEHSDMEALFALGNALGLAKYPFPREMWPILPGGMPYVTVKA